MPHAVRPPRRTDLATAASRVRGPKATVADNPMPVATRLEHSPRDLLAINTDAMDAVLQHHSQRAAAGPGRAAQLDALASDEDTAEGLASRLELQLWLDTYAVL